MSRAAALAGAVAALACLLLYLGVANHHAPGQLLARDLECKAELDASRARGDKLDAELATLRARHAALEAEPHDRLAVLRGGHVERRAPEIVARLPIDARVEEGLHHALVALAARVEERRRAVLVAHLLVGAASDQKGHDRLVALLRRGE